MRKVALVGHSYIGQLVSNPEIVFDYDDVIFRAWRGRNSETLRNHAVRNILAWRPDLVFLQIGGNEIGPSDDEEWQDGYKRISGFIELFLEAGIMIRIGEVMPRPQPWPEFGVTADHYRSTRGKINKRLKRWCGKNDPRKQVISFGLEDPVRGPTRYPDGVHLNEDGVRVYWGAIVAGGRQALGLEE